MVFGRLQTLCTPSAHRLAPSVSTRPTQLRSALPYAIAARHRHTCCARFNSVVLAIDARHADGDKQGDFKPRSANAAPKQRLTGAKKAAVRNKLFRSFAEVAEGKKVHAPKNFESDDILAVFQQHDITPLILEAHKADRLPNMVPLLDRIFDVLPEETVYNTDVLNILEPLAQITDDFHTDDSLSSTLNTMLAVWLQPLQLALKKDDPDSTITSVQSSSAAGESMQQQGLSAMQPSDKSQGPTSTTTASQAEEPHVPMTMAPKYVKIARNDDLSPTAYEAYRLLMTEPDRTSRVQHSELWQRQNALLRKLKGGPHGKLARQAYVKRHTNIFRFDFNAEMSRRRRLAAQQSSQDDLADDDVSNVLSPGVDVGYSHLENESKSASSRQSDAVDPYL